MRARSSAASVSGTAVGAADGAGSSRAPVWRGGASPALVAEAWFVDAPGFESRETATHTRAAISRTPTMIATNLVRVFTTPALANPARASARMIVTRRECDLPGCGTGREEREAIPKKIH
jgi:hypothetical protein